MRFEKKNHFRGAWVFAGWGILSICGTSWDENHNWLSAKKLERMLDIICAYWGKIIDPREGRGGGLRICTQPLLGSKSQLIIGKQVEKTLDFIDAFWDKNQPRKLKIAWGEGKGGKGVSWKNDRYYTRVLRRKKRGGEGIVLKNLKTAWYYRASWEKNRFLE